MAGDDIGEEGFDDFFPSNQQGGDDASNESPPPASPPPPPPLQPRESPLGFAATPTEPPPATSWNNQAASATPTAPMTMSEPAPVPPPLASGSSSSKLPWIVAVLAAVVLLGGGAFFAASILGATAGAETPEAAADGLVAALENEDFVAAAELLEPSERRTIAEPMLTEVLPQLVRLGAIDESTEADNVEDFDLELTDTEIRVEDVPGAPDLRYVFITGGQVDVDGNVEGLPTDSDTPLVVVERDGQWYYSLWFTLAENARIEAGEPLPSQAESPAPIPSDSPEAAVEGMMNAVSDFDLRAMIGHMDPEEMAALYRYSPLFLDEAQQALDEAQGDLASEGISWDITNFDFDVDSNGDDAVVSMRGFTVTASAPDFDMELDYRRENITGAASGDGDTLSLAATTTEFDVEGSVDGEPFNITVSVDPENLRASLVGNIADDSGQAEVTLDPAGVCSEYSASSSDGTNESGCLEEEGNGEFLVGPFIEALESWPTEFPGINMTVHQTDGGWYISPMGTIFDGVVSGLEGIEEDSFDDLFDDVSNGFGSVLEEDITDDFLGGFDDDDIFQDDFDDDFEISEPVEGSVTDFSYGGDPTAFEGDLSAGTFDVYSAEFESGSEVLVTAIAIDPSLDTIITVRDASGNEIARNDDALADLPSSLDSQTDFVVDADGVYTIEVSDFGNSDSGLYALTVEPGSVDAFVNDEPAVVPDPIEDVPDAVINPQGAIVVEPGGAGVTQGFVGGDQGNPVYDIDLTGGDDVVITVESIDPDQLDPRVELLFQGDSIGINDDAADRSAVADNFDSQLLVSPPLDGTYQIVVDGFAGSEGEFVMTIERN